MLGKLIKHQLRDTARIIPLSLIVVAFFIIATIISVQAGAGVPVILFAVFLLFTGFLAMYFIIGYCVIRFYKNVYGAEGYLTMTLPVAEKQIYASWTVTGIIWIAIGTVFAVISYFVGMDAIFMFSPDDAGNSEEIAMIMSSGFYIIMILGVFIGSLSILIELYFCTTIAHVKPFRKLGLGSAVLAYIALYGIQLLITMPLTFFVPLSVQYIPGTGWQYANISMVSAMTDLMNPNSFSPEHATIGIAAFFWYLVPLIVLPVLTVRMMREKINLK
ncbi:MAG: hypothetical protein FWG94_09590 [Oscillospiraceae bacterium]|nr:hypothetical protein [Oscillospiraceae bacterium]